MRDRGFFVGVSLLALSVSTLSAGTPGFVNRTSDAGINAVQQTFSGVPAWLAGGGAVGDFNRDGWQDFFFCGGGANNNPDGLWINNKDGTFTDQAAAWGVAAVHRSSGAAVGDFNNDGWPDIYVSSLGPVSASAIGHHKLYRNNGDGTFTDIALAAGVKTSATIYPDGCGGAWGDYDLDGDLDLAVAGYYPFADGNRLYRNNGDETFTDVTTSVGLSPTGIYGYSPRFIDMNGDRYPELIISADGPTTRYYINDGDGTFTNGTAASNMVNGDSDMGMTCADFDGDGDWDVYITTKGSNRLFMNQGGHVYINLGVASGSSFTGWGWAAVTIDFDHDTRPDIVTHSQITGNPNAHPWAFRNVTAPAGPVMFDEVGAALGLPGGFFNDGRGLSRFDYDNDGDQDFICFNYNQGVVLFRNELTGPDTNWLRVFLDSEGEPGLPTDGSGAVIKVTVGATTWLGRIDGGSNYISQDENSAHFGLAGHTMIDEIRVEWTNGLVTTATAVPANQTLILTPNGCIMNSDVNRDYSVDFGDLNAILSRWGQSGDFPEDTDDDGSVNFGDLNVILNAWGDTCP